jgi:predicted metal-binding protein/ubiquinone/menaquinone biosynthesis C-methylase UbiE
MNRIPFADRDPQDAGPQYLEDLATGYWFSLSLFTAVEAGLFGLLEPAGKTLDEISSALGFKREGTDRFLRALCRMGLLVQDGPQYFNAGLASNYLVAGKDHYQGDSILWRKDLIAQWSGIKDCLEAGGRIVKDSGHEDQTVLSQRRWKYLRAMDCMAKTKVREMLPLFEGCSLGGEMLDVGAGSGAVAAGFLDRFPLLKATLLDIPEVLEHTRNFIRERGMEGRADLIAGDILGPWPVEKGRFDFVMLSNIIHAYSEKELPHILAESVRCMKDEGILVIHDFFFEHFSEKAALFDLNMFINTYNGRVFSDRNVSEELERLNLHTTDLIPLGTDTALLIASRKGGPLADIVIDKKARLTTKVKTLGFRNVVPVPVSAIHIPGWTDMRCRFGCGYFGKPNCPPHAPSPEKTKNLIKDYSYALLLEGEPPTRDFQLQILQAEKEAFTTGFYKAFSYWAGPCSLCHFCTVDGICHNTKDARPSMEGAGIDVFETVKRAGLSLRTLNKKDEFVRYFGLILLE